MQLGRGETLADTARVLSRYVDAIMIRMLEPRTTAELAALRHGAGDQRPDPAVASLPGDGRRDDVRGASRSDPRPHGRLDRRRQQRAVVVDRCRRRVSASRCDIARRTRASAADRASTGRVLGGGRDQLRRRPGARRCRAPLRRHRLPGCRWATRREPAATTCSRPTRSIARLMAQRRARRDLHALPAGPSRRGGHRRGDRRSAIGGVRRGGKPAACAEGRAGLVSSESSREHVAERAAIAPSVGATTSSCRSRSNRSTCAAAWCGWVRRSIGCSAPRLSGAGGEARGGGGGARRAARLDPQARGPLPAADAERRPGRHAARRLRRAVEPARARAVRPGAGLERRRGARDLLGAGIWRSPSIRAAT